MSATSLSDIDSVINEAQAALEIYGAWLDDPSPEQTRQLRLELIELTLANRFYEEACLEAAEIVGPNSHEYEGLVESIVERKWQEYSASSLG